MCCPCMIATNPLATGSKLNCFISTRGMLTIIWHCVLVFFWFFFVEFYMLVNDLLKRSHWRHYQFKDYEIGGIELLEQN